MKNSVRAILVPLFSGLIVVVFASLALKTPKKIQIGFLVHDLVADRWRKDTESFAREIEQLGGELILKNAFGSATDQVAQGKLLIDEGIKVIAVVAQDGNLLGELVEYANKNGAKIIAYDRMILNCNLDYYISFNGIKVGELMSEYALKLKPKGNYVILNGPASDNNALLIRQGLMKNLQKHIDNGSVKVLLEKEMDSWYGLSALLVMNDFIATKQHIDVLITGSDDLATGAIDAFNSASLPTPIVTGQDASLDACRNIVLGKQSMTVYKSIKKLSKEAAILAMKLATGKKVEFTTSLSNGKKDVPSFLFDPVAVDKSNLETTVVADGHIKTSDLK